MFNYKDDTLVPKNLGVAIPATLELSFDNEIPMEEFESYTLIVQDGFGPKKCEVTRKLTPKLVAP